MAATGGGYKQCSINKTVLFLDTKTTVIEVKSFKFKNSK